MFTDSVAAGHATLRFAPEMRPPSWDAGEDREVWWDNFGRECAYGRIAGGRPWMRVLGIGDFRLDAPDAAAVVPIPGVAAEDVADTYYRTVLPMGLQLVGHEVLHASAVTTPDGVLGLCAVSHTGKSTLAVGLQRRGHPLFADDALVFDIEGGRPRLTAVPFAMRLRPESAAYFGEKPREQVRVASGSGYGTVDLPLAGVCVLERLPEVGDEETVVVEPLTASEAFSAVLPHAYCFSLRDTRRKAAMMRNYLTFAAAVPVWRVRFRTGLRHLSAVLDAIEASAGIGATGNLSPAPNACPFNAGDPAAASGGS